MRGSRSLVMLLAGLIALSFLGFPLGTPYFVFVGLLSAICPLCIAWIAARGTALRAAIIWAGIALSFALVSQVLACREPLASGRPSAGHWTYLSTLATLAALVSVLNARRPGGGAWAILMSLLLVVFLIPWLEGPGLARKAEGLSRLRLDAPWTIFYGFLVLAGVSNYLPTAFGISAGWLAVGFVAEYVALTRPEIWGNRLGLAWSVGPWTLATGIWAAFFRSNARERGRASLEAVWLWFRDYWGVVWALRTQERFNRSAETAGWPVRLTWQGLVSTAPKVDGLIDVPEAAFTTFLALLRRFADKERMEELLDADARSSCQRHEAQ